MESRIPAVGIVAEYNPFHLGHLYQINETVRKLGSDVTVISVISGDFVQRGEPAVFSKFDRAQAACLSGANIVVEMPVAHSLSSAEFFADSALYILNSLGVSWLSFGAECDSIQILQDISRCLLNDSFSSILKKQQKESKKSFATLRAEILKDTDSDFSDVISKPNNILAVEYIKAIYRNRLNIEPMAIKREGNPHDENINNGYKSSSFLRTSLLNGDGIASYVPKDAENCYYNAVKSGRGPVSSKILEQAILSRLRYSEDCFRNVPDSNESIESRIIKASKNAGSLSQLYSGSATKAYTNSKIRRICMNAVIGTKENDLKNKPEYLRILAADSKGVAYLKKNRENINLPVISQGNEIKKCSAAAQRQFALGSAAHDLYVLGFDNIQERICGQDYRYSLKPTE